MSTYNKSRYKFSDEQFILVVKSSSSIHQALVKLGLNAAGNCYKVFHNRAKRLKLNTNHFTGQLWSKGKKLGHTYSLKQVFDGSRKLTSHRIRLRLISDGYKLHKCEQCNITIWNDLPVPLELHHKDGKHDNNALDNLQLLCPNCHAQTPNYSGRNRNKNRSGGI